MSQFPLSPKHPSYILDVERREERAYHNAIEAAADQAAREVDIETVLMFRKRNLPLPKRLSSSPWVRNFLFQSFGET